MNYEISTSGPNRLRLRELFQEFADELWTPAHFADKQAAAFAFDQFKRSFDAEIRLLEVKACADPKLSHK